jgi:hypothetical protein
MRDSVNRVVRLHVAASSDDTCTRLFPTAYSAGTLNMVQSANAQYGTISANLMLDISQQSLDNKHKRFTPLQ